MIHLTPFGLVRQQPITSDAYAQLVYSDVEEWDEVVAGRAIKLTWENKPLNGYFITDYGNIIAFQPATVEIDNSIMTMMILIAVSVSVPGVIIGLICMNSPFLQRKYAERRKRIWKKKELQRSDNRK